MSPLDVIKYDRSHEELQHFLLFAMCVAGKNATQQGEKLVNFLRLIRNAGIGAGSGVTDTTFSHILNAGRGKVGELLREVMMGKYNLLIKGFTEAACKYENGGLDRASVDDLTKITGVGLKTAKFFIMFSREDEKHAVLDTHILKWLGSLGYDNYDEDDLNLPTVSPRNPSIYAIWEYIFFDEVADALGVQRKDISPRQIVEADFAIWKHYAKGETLPEYLQPK